MIHSHALMENLSFFTTVSLNGPLCQDWCWVFGVYVTRDANIDFHTDISNLNPSYRKVDFEYLILLHSNGILIELATGLKCTEAQTPLICLDE